MENRIDQCFAALRARKEKAFIAYICAGDPNLERTIDLALALEKAGTDILELGLPFSDPLADGIVNQLAAQRALEAGTTVQGVLDCVRQIRRVSQIPIVLYTYMNPIFQFGFERFHREASDAGIDGLLILDLPPEEDLAAQSEALLHIRLIAPTTPAARVETICAKAAGFIYYVSREGECFLVAGGTHRGNPPLDEIADRCRLRDLEHRAGSRSRGKRRCDRRWQRDRAANFPGARRG